MTQLSANFTLEEMTRSTTGERLGLDNTPDDQTIENMKFMAAGMESVRALLGFPIHVDSGYRSQAVNHAVGGATNSDHVLGWACDFLCDSYGPPQTVCKAIISSGIKFHKLIFEGSWTHISFNPLMADEVITAHFGAGGTTYTEGIA